MLFSLNSISLKNQIWFLTILSASAIGAYGFWAIHDLDIPATLHIASRMTIAVLWLIAVVVSKILVEKINKEISGISKKLNTSCVEEKQNIENIQGNLDKFISLTGKQLDDLKESEKFISTVSNMLKDTSQNAEECKMIATKVTRDVAEGYDIMQKMVDSILTIEKTKDDLAEISTLINKISNDTSAIHNIVSTTELLSLNASIEAARAGEAGKGFSVVAEEVGILAKNSGREAQEIEKIVLNSQNKINELMQQNQERVSEGKIVSNDGLAVFSAIKDAMFGISSRSENIRSATIEQKIGIDQVNSGSDEIKLILKRNISDTINLIKICKTNEKNYKNISEISEVINDFLHENGSK